MTLYMETTKIPATRTAAEVQGFLADAGAKQVLTTYGQDGKIVGLEFRLDVDGKELYFALPVRTKAVFSYLQHQRSPRFREKPENVKNDRAQAERVAWRQLLRWVEAQFAMIEVGMVQPVEVFLPYLKVDSGQTLFERFAATKQLPAAVTG